MKNIDRLKKRVEVLDKRWDFYEEFKDNIDRILNPKAEDGDLTDEEKVDRIRIALMATYKKDIKLTDDFWDSGYYDF